ncbi:MAG: hypothetical protein CBC09_00720 [Cellvibrionales bacterium TMED49]|mgnify:CR=1 FL=1|nr:hypothetical protein [Porticoccaceae bacterium]OUU40197.1 MAG: hypothetical protein CBC09_00720 [Cellvibrionales bacterium TMED49]RPG91272.1 MAG: hypothetical protein CBD08_003550 [Cellvibrionales bacterium TMED148]
MPKLDHEPLCLITSGCLQKQLSAGFLKNLGAWSYLVDHVQEQKHSSGTSFNTSSDEMALTAVVRGLEEVEIPSNIEVTVTNEFLMNGATLWLYAWKKNNWKTFTGQEIENKKLWQELEKRIDFHTKVTWKLASTTKLRPEINFVDKLCQLEIAAVISGL